MRALVLHPEDSLFDRRWSKTKWDFVLDLGVAGASTYAEWSRSLGCGVSTLASLRLADDSVRLRKLLDFPRGQVVDDVGFDWWDLNSVFFYQPLEQAMLLARLVEPWRQVDEIVVSRSCFQAEILRILFGLRMLVSRGNPGSTTASKMKHYARVLSKFSFSQLSEILGDKYDPEYSLRRRFANKLSSSRESVVLLPSAYSNASRILAAYAQLVPEQPFLLVATRHSATTFDPPPNVRVVSLAAYADVPHSRGEVSALISKWDGVIRQMEEMPVLRLFVSTGGFDNVPQLITTGVAVRDAWVKVFERHDVSAVFSGDEGNPYVCLPLLLANRQQIPSISVHHGALDGRFRLKVPAAEFCLAKSRMEEDYLVRECGVDPRRVLIGAPGTQVSRKAIPLQHSPLDIIYFSEPYEAFAGRAAQIYQELLPALCRIARHADKRVVVKLHPFESLRERKQLVERVLGAEDRRVVAVVDGPLTPALLASTWFGITVQSTVAAECALEGIPCFLCGWLADPSFGYARQFAKFGAGYLLNSPEDIAGVPQILSSYQVPLEVRANLGSPITVDTLRCLLTGTAVTPAAAAVG
jgi:hypothetical protein